MFILICTMVCICGCDDLLNIAQDRFNYDDLYRMMQTRCMFTARFMHIFQDC